uniref:Dihydrolipoamide acetyltransferase component of pyruvate dehydrogenase complex n=1 Tax=Glossina pallidipes TaxID=7398 RepID=A0A1A9Z1C9_GLOPL
MNTVVKIPDIGTEDAEVTEILVKIEDKIKVEQSLITVEGDKASMQIPSPISGIVKKIMVKIGDKVFSNQEIMLFEKLDNNDNLSSSNTLKKVKNELFDSKNKKPKQIYANALGILENAEIINIFVYEKNNISTNYPVLTIQDLKGTRKILSPESGTVKNISIKVGDKINSNTSLSQDQKKIILKQYFNIGIAVNTEQGLVVPIIFHADSKGIIEISQEISYIAEKARSGKLSAKDIKGGCFTISNLGGIGGKEFTPIINSPEVAILGVSQSSIQAIWNGNIFVPRLMLPLSLSYDHRVIDGVEGAKFINFLKNLISDIRLLTL